MAEEDEKDIGFIKFSGDLVPHGVIDAGAAGSALTGLSEILRFFNEKQSAEFARFEYELPVRTEAGSWVAVVLATGGGAFALAYLKKAGEKMAEKDFGDIGFSDVLKRSMAALQYLFKLVKHTGLFKNWGGLKIVWRDSGREIGFPGADGEYLYVPVEHFRLFENIPSKHVSKLIFPIQSGRMLAIGLEGHGEVTLSNLEKHLFVEDAQEEDEDFLFPELEHGASVKLEGRLIRGNQAANSVGLEYMGHVINCHPEHGNIRQYKSALFLRCVVEGYVTRFAKQRLVAEKRPTIFISKVVPLESDDQYGLFGD